MRNNPYQIGIECTALVERQGFFYDTGKLEDFPVS